MTATAQIAQMLAGAAAAQRAAADAYRSAAAHADAAARALATAGAALAGTTPPATAARPVARRAASTRPVVAPATGAAADTAVAVAGALRMLPTYADGVALLKSQRLDRAQMLVVARELLLTRVDRLSDKKLRELVLKQAILDRDKFAGLRTW